MNENSNFSMGGNMKGMMITKCALAECRLNEKNNFCTGVMWNEQEKQGGKMVKSARITTFAREEHEVKENILSARKRCGNQQK